MKTITVQVREDHLETLARTKPMTAMSELIWNALDAEATEVRVDFIENDLGGIEAIRITDNGHGLHFDDADTVFQNLGGSWKRIGNRTQNRGRVLHGKYGKGRFRAFSMGNRVGWQSVYHDNEHSYTYTIDGKASNLGQFVLSRPKLAPGLESGMIVEIFNCPDNVELLRGVKAQSEITDIFALYLRQYPDVKLSYDNIPIDPANAESLYKDYDLDEMIMQNGEHVKATLSVVEWNISGKRGVFFCDEDGFMRNNALPRLYFRGFSYTAYLKSAHVDLLDREGLLEAGVLSPDVRQLLDAARAKLREHFTLREAERAQDTIDEWKQQEIYPYEGEAKNSEEESERRIFDIYATHLDQIFPDFTKSSVQSKRLTLRLFQELVRTEPTRVARILDEVLNFPEDKEGEVLELLKT